MVNLHHQRLEALEEPIQALRMSYVSTKEMRAQAGSKKSPKPHFL
jgi:hypothetical protein